MFKCSLFITLLLYANQIINGPFYKENDQVIKFSYKSLQFVKYPIKIWEPQYDRVRSKLSYNNVCYKGTAHHITKFYHMASRLGVK